MGPCSFEHGNSRPLSAWECQAPQRRHAAAKGISGLPRRAETALCALTVHRQYSIALARSGGCAAIRRSQCHRQPGHGMRSANLASQAASACGSTLPARTAATARRCSSSHMRCFQPVCRTFKKALRPAPFGTGRIMPPLIGRVSPGHPAGESVRWEGRRLDRNRRASPVPR